MNRFSILMLLTGLLHVPELFAAPATLGVLALAEKPALLIRGTVLYHAAPGTRLQAGDLIDSDQSMLQIDELAGFRLGLGPHTRIYLERTGKTTSIALFNGWLKLQPKPGEPVDNLRVSTATLTLDASGGASVMHADGTRMEVFVEDGTQTLIERDPRGRDGPRTTLTQEDYLQRKGNDPLGSPGRPGSDFISAMPPAFFDPLPAIAGAKLAAPPLDNVREVDFDDVSPLLLGPFKPSAKSLATRFSPRLSDPAFRQAITERFGGTLEWETELWRFERKARVH